MNKKLFLVGLIAISAMFCELSFASNPTLMVKNNANVNYAWPMLVRRATILKTPADVVSYSNVAVKTPLQLVKFGEPLPEKTTEAKEAKAAKTRQRNSIKRYAAKKMMCTGDSLLRTFFWDGKADKYVLTIFNAETTSKYVVTNEQASKGVGFTLSPGKYTWAVAPLSETGVEESVTLTDSIYVENPFYLSNMTSEVDLNSARVTYSWEGNCDYYVLFVFEEPTKRILSSTTTKGTSVDAILPSEGVYSWALMGVNPYGYRNVVCSALGEATDMNADEEEGVERINMAEKMDSEATKIYDAKDPNSGFEPKEDFYDILGRKVDTYYRGVVVQKGRRYLLWY